MPDVTEAGRVFIREGTPLPAGLQVETESYMPGWRLIRNLYGNGLGRKLQEAGWTFFCLASEINATVFGLDERKTVRRAVARILANPRSDKFNSLEIMQMALAPSRRFLGVVYVTVSACSRHIQKSVVLHPAKDLSGRERTMVVAA
jgi:hypothetical protein